MSIFASEGRVSRKPYAARPIQNVGRRGLNGVIANALRPTGKRARAAVEINHLLDRVAVPRLEHAEINVGHFAKRPILRVLSHLPQYFRRGSLKDRQTQQWHPVPERDGKRAEAAE